ncbi:MAG TPA: carbohydrate ABC transporter permease [Chloroflexus aurantiacus]|jgi:multiple sugar transport system permease protein|uniref:Binding-protein-dependent transport systems inner membrane component n=1 Tax=Chloroflexus aurantiacus (strain ATCC 29366 / DSM 635 / J-10-fl) TaxID=324602 RepID=A9WJH7_CHLAA|nr:MULTISPECIES: carbohydrate ABC transporter permease [Chloroflexus]ABY35881.1 binding-protein-dependent transport systems inner membrane component [Chloroflexus aurantiacus J-10-fl]RMG51320.1 MAG: carbohydrate ABC transporter permease [Chloroflexota bacterium]GIV91620.1 MAG: ABC transporter permease [Chloroflexus sp.]HBW69252.1 carbohydrate ABC transporter permease [Chloroflexus aurantiacus]
MASAILRRPWERLLAYLVLSVTGFIMVFPFIYMVLSSLKPSTEVVQVPPTLWPSEIRWSNYLEVLSIVPLGTQLINTIIVTVLVVLGWVFTSVLAGYAFARLDFPGREWLFGAYLATLMVPFAVLIVPMYRLMLVFGWVDRLEALIIPWLFTAYGTFLLRQFFMSVPKDLEDAALIDGASHWGILFRIFLPLARPAIATLATFAFLYAWNSFLWPLIIISSPDRKVVTQGLVDLQALYAARVDLIMAGSTLAVLPTLIVFLFAQRYFIEGIATSGLAGR